MSTTNGHAKRPPPAPAGSYRERLREKRAEIELRRLEHEAELLEHWGGSGVGAGYGWGWPNPFDLATPGPDGRFWFPVLGAGRVDARKDGADRPFVWTDVDLDRSRELARWLAAKNPPAQGALESLADYTVGTGYQYAARPGKRFRRDGAAVALAAMVEEVIEEFQSLNKLGGGAEECQAWADREWNAVVESVSDGEKLFRVFGRPDGTSLVRDVLPEQLRQPPDRPEPEYSFGIRHAPGDVECKLEYAVCYGEPSDWEPVPADQIAHLKLNARGCVKRGISDFYSAGEALEEAWKLLRVMRITGSAQAAIAWIEQHPQATQQSLDALVGKQRALNVPRFPDPLTGRDNPSRRLDPGQALVVGGNREYLAAPLAANTANHLNIFGASMRAVASRWRMPEYMISGDASNANMASHLVSGTPFVKRVETRQAVYGRFFLRVLWMAVRNAARAGRFVHAGRRYSYEEISRLVDVMPTPPAVALVDKKTEADVDEKDLANGVLSIQTRRARRGLDDETERKHLREEPPTRIQGRVTDLDAQGNPVGRPGGGGGPGPPARESADPLAARLSELRERYGAELSAAVTEAAARLLENKDKLGHGSDPHGGTHGETDADREARKAARRQARTGFHEAIRDVFQGKGVDTFGDHVTVKAGAHTLSLEYEPHRRSAYIEFLRSQSGDDPFGATGEGLQQGTLAFGRQLTALVGALGDRGVGVTYETKDPRRARLYSAVLSRAGFAKVKGKELGMALWRRPEAAPGPRTQEALERTALAWQALLEGKDRLGHGSEKRRVGATADSAFAHIQGLRRAAQPLSDEHHGELSRSLAALPEDHLRNLGNRYRVETPAKASRRTRAGLIADHVAGLLAGGKGGPVQAPAPSGPAPEEHRQAVLSGVKRLDTAGTNLVALADLRDHLHTQGLSRDHQDAAIADLRRSGHVSATAIEGRHGITERERAAAIAEGDSLLGYLALRQQ